MPLNTGAKTPPHEGLSEQPQEVVAVNVSQLVSLERAERQDEVSSLVLNAIPALLADALRLEPGVHLANLVQDAFLDDRDRPASLDMQDVGADALNGLVQLEDDGVVVR